MSESLLSTELSLDETYSFIFGLGPNLFFHDFKFLSSCSCHIESLNHFWISEDLSYLCLNSLLLEFMKAYFQDFPSGLNRFEKANIQQVNNMRRIQKKTHNCVVNDILKTLFIHVDNIYVWIS